MQILPYRAQEITGWFDECAHNMNHMLHPSKSPNLNLLNACVRLWSNVLHSTPVEFRKRLRESMTKSAKVALEAQGGPTSY